MKKIKIVLFIVLAMGTLLSSCSSDDNNENVQGNIIGKWIFTKKGFIVNGQENLEDYPYVEECGEAGRPYMEFYTNGTFKDVVFYHLLGECKETIETGTWEKNGNTLTTVFDFDGLTNVMTIISLTNNELKETYTYTEEGETITEVYLYKRAN